MKKPSRLDYAYAVGRVRALENKLISRGVFLEAADEKDIDYSLKVIFDAGQFFDEMTNIRTSEDLDRFLEREQQELFRLIEKIMPDKEILNILFLRDNLEESFRISLVAGYEFIIEYVRRKIDLGNLKVLVRAKYLELSRDRLKKNMVKGGFIKKDELVEYFDLSFSEIGEKLQSTPYRSIWEKSYEALEEEETLVVLERGIEDYLMNHLRKSKQIVFGPEPVFAYALARQRELSLVRLLGIGKINQIPVSILKKRMSETYV